MTDTPPKKRKKGKYSTLIVVLFLIGTILLQHAFLFLFVALLPTIVAYIVDTKPRQPIFITVAALNFAGLVPYIFDIAFSPNMLRASADMMGNMFTWLFIYSAAGLGWILILVSPMMCSATLQGMRKGQIMHLESQQKKLVDEWGPEVQRKG